MRLITIVKKAQKAMFKLRHTLYQLNLKPRISLKLYDSLIRPIYTYGSKVWGAYINSKDKMFNVNCEKIELFDKACFEKLDLKFAKSLLGVHKKSSNAAVRGELARYPSIIFGMKLVVKNWFRVTNYGKDTLLHNTYLCNLQLMAGNKKCWLWHIRNFVNNTLGLVDVWNNQGVGRNKGKQINTVVNNTKCIFEFQWLNYINRNKQDNGDGNKLRTYCMFKRRFEYEKYLDLQNNFHIRRHITRLRISSHRLEIEVGRYGIKRVDREERICKLL